MTKLLINEHPLMVLPALATVIGLNEAIVLQQVHYWLEPRLNKNIKEGKLWVYNTYAQWKEQFPFWSKNTIIRAIKNLEEKGLLIGEYFNDNPFLNLKWYTIDYDQLDKIDTKNNTSTQNEQTPLPKMGRSYIDTETTTETTSLSVSPKSNDRNRERDKENNIENNFVGYDPDYHEKEMINIWNKIVKDGKDPCKITKYRIAALIKVFGVYFNINLDNWKNYCLKIKSSKFLMGESKSSDFKADLDWAIKPDNIQKILEGGYGIGDRAVKANEEPITDIEDDKELDPTWKEVREMLKKELGMATFKSWISKLSLDKLEGNEVILIAPNKFIQEWIVQNYKTKILGCFKGKLPGIKKININLR